MIERLQEEQRRTAGEIQQIHARIQQMDQERGRLALLMERKSARLELCQELIGEIGAQAPEVAAEAQE